LATDRPYLRQRDIMARRRIASGIGTGRRIAGPLLFCRETARYYHGSSAAI
jgi:hypothetical protein